MNKLGNYFSDKYLMTSDSIPTEGSFEVGDIVINTGENISEEPFWICTESGTPGVWQSINVKSTTKMVSFKNKVILTEATDTVNIGIDSFNIERDTLIVFINDAYAYEHVDYVIDGTNIKTLDNKIWNEGLIEDFVFEFIVFKSILCIDESGMLLLDQIPDGVLTVNKFSQDIQEKLNFATTDLSVYQKHTEQNLPTNNKTIVGAINELFQNVDSGKGLIAAAIDDESITKDSTFQAMSNTIENLKKSSENELSGVTNLKIVLSDEGVEVTEDDNLSSLITKVDNEFNEKSNKLYDLMLDNGFEVNNNMNMNDLLNLLETKGMGKSPVKQIACGDGHTAILKEDGTLWMSGSNGYGQLLLGHKRTKFAFLLAATDVDQVACGNQHTLILKKDGTLWGIGYNAYCPLGTGSADSPTELTQITTNINNDVKEIYSTLYQTFIVKKDGTLWTAGYNNYGQLGIGSSSYAYSFTEVSGITNVKQVACGTYHTMVLKEDGTVWACGWNSKGELGLNDTTDRNTFTQVTENVSDVKKIICSNMSTLMLKNDGTLWGTGDNSYSQLGFSNTSAKKFTNISSISDVLDASMGSYFTYVIKNDNTLWSRGYKYVGQLGLGSSGEGNITSFTQVTENVSNDAKCVVCGEDYAMLLKTDGEVYGTGCSTSGEIGTGGNVNLSIFEKTSI